MMLKKTAILLGSPRKDGNSDSLAAAFAKGASQAGYSHQTVRMHGLKIGGCIDCRRCWTNGSHCFLNDDMKEVYKVLDHADVIVFAAPLYFYSWPAQIKSVWDRLLPYYMPNSKVDMRGRRAILLAAAGDDSDTCFDGLRKSFELACAYCKWEIAGMICATDVYEAGAIAGKGDWLAKAESLGRNI
jgi:multimeric flavodoxin WrbA